MVKRTLDQVIEALQEQRKVDGGKVQIEVDGELLEMVEMWGPEPVPQTVPFLYYLHDSYAHGELVEWISLQTGISRDHPVWEKMGRPFLRDHASVRAQHGDRRCGDSRGGRCLTPRS